MVIKFYSCYKKENVFDKIKYLFIFGVKIVKVCRRCMFYKKFKEVDNGIGVGKGKVKVVKGKFVKFYSVKLIKNVKIIGKVNFVKGSEKVKVISVEKNSVKLLVRDDKKRKDSGKDEKIKF